MISHRALAELIAGIILLVVLIFAALAYRDQLVGRATAEAQGKAESAANAVLIQQNQTLAQAIKDSQAAIAQMKAEEDAKIASLQGQRAAAVTPDQLSALIAQITGIKPVVVERPSTTPGQPASQVATIGLPDLSKLGDFATACAECKVSLDSANQQIVVLQGQTVNLKQQEANVAEQLANETKVAEGWKNAAKGGTWVQRLGKDLKSAAGATAGAAIGAGACSKSSPGVMAGCAGAGALIGMIGGKL